MTLAEALEKCSEEYNALVSSCDFEELRKESELVVEEHDIIRRSSPYKALMREFGASPVTDHCILLSMRFGMRVQRKLDSANAGTSKPNANAEQSAKT